MIKPEKLQCICFIL